MKLSIQSLCLWVVVAALAIALAISRMTTDRALEISVPDNSYAWSVTESQIKDSPTWEKVADNPPVSAKRAILISQQIIEQLNESSKSLSVGSWNLESMSLVRIDKNRFYPDADEKWCYLLEFSGVNIPLHGGAPYRFAALILMDETIILGRGNSIAELDEKMAIAFTQTE